MVFVRRSIRKIRISIYAALQNGVLVRFDKRTGERIGIQPQPGRGEDPSALELGFAFHHQPTLAHPTLFRCRQTLSHRRSRRHVGNSSAVNSRAHLDRDKLPVMGKVWGIDAVAKNASTAFFGNASALAESPKKGWSDLRRH